jgi:peptidoglycan/xylan/chitin deacetylase (PgdA/CDA1 family)
VERTAVQDDTQTTGGGSHASLRHLDRYIKCLISLLFWGASELWRNALRLAGRPLPPRSTVIYYHRVQPHERVRFAKQLDHLLKWTTPINADIDEALPNGSRCVAVTFDDGWCSFAACALPELRQREIPVTLFAIAGRLNQMLDTSVDEALLSEAQLVQLAAQGVTIGSHTLTHCALTGLDEATVLYELGESRRRLSALLNRDVRLFAFPFSQSNAHLIELCRAAGYRRVFTGLPYLAYSHRGEFASGRIRVDPADWPLEFHLKLMGAYQWLPAAFALKSRLRYLIHYILGRSRSQAQSTTSSWRSLRRSPQT